MERLVANGGIFIGEGAVVEGPIYFVFGNCELLELSGGTFHQNLDLTGTRITNALVLEFAAWTDPLGWEPFADSAQRYC